MAGTEHGRKAISGSKNREMDVRISLESSFQG